eukprot:2012736-Pyramimonas_sp.AAC.1
MAMSATNCSACSVFTPSGNNMFNTMGGLDTAGLASNIAMNFCVTSLFWRARRTAVTWPPR